MDMNPNLTAGEAAQLPFCAIGQHDVRKQVLTRVPRGAAFGGPVPSYRVFYADRCVGCGARPEELS